MYISHWFKTWFSEERKHCWHSCNDKWHWCLLLWLNIHAPNPLLPFNKTVQEAYIYNILSLISYFLCHCGYSTCCTAFYHLIHNLRCNCVAGTVLHFLHNSHWTVVTMENLKCSFWLYWSCVVTHCHIFSLCIHTVFTKDFISSSMNFIWRYTSVRVDVCTYLHKVNCTLKI